ncbi:MAG: hypothetical protein K6F93_08675 [Lachnospiraceae bacterium]|nr:hypothetical protein [Lachnospiraceae bacterium]
MKIPKIKLLIYFLLFAALAAVIIMVTVEAFGGGNCVIDNKTGKAIKSMEVVVVDEEIMDIEVLYEGEVSANSVVKSKFDRIDLSANEEAQVYIGVAFEDAPSKIEILEGYITGSFNGNMDIDIYEEDGKLYLKAKLGTVLFGSTKDTNLDDTFVLLPEESDYDYVD